MRLASELCLNGETAFQDRHTEASAPQDIPSQLGLVCKGPNPNGTIFC